MRRIFLAAATLTLVLLSGCEPRTATFTVPTPVCGVRLVEGTNSVTKR
ncbi:MAG: hypothetical protein GXX99_02665 [Clostridiales bacterium]|nr:hypothetical protein [Clostridiales bacterium]